MLVDSNAEFQMLFILRKRNKNTPEIPNSLIKVQVRLANPRVPYKQIKTIMQQKLDIEQIDDC